MKVSEKAEQIALVRRCRIEGVFIYMCENSLHFPIKPEWKGLKILLHRLTEQRLQMGQVNGIPDLFVPSLKLYIEMKSEKGRVSKEQQEIHEKLKSFGYDVQVFYLAFEAWTYIKERIQYVHSMGLQQH